MTKQRKADLLLVMVTFFWGASYYLTDLCSADLSPMTLTAFRFCLAFLLLAAVFWKHVRRMNRITLKYSVLVGLALTGTYVFYGYGITRTSISNAAFICALPVAVTPLLEFAVYRKKPGKKLGAALLLCAVGLALLSLNEDMRPAVGDLLCLCVPLCYSADLLLTEKGVQHPEVDPLALGVCQLGVVGVITLVCAFAIEKPHLPSTPAIWGAALFLSLFCTGIAFVVQSVEQQYTTASHVGLIFTLEPVFAAIVAYFLAHEHLRPRGYVGAAMMLFSLVLMEADLGALLGKRTEPDA